MAVRWLQAAAALLLFATIHVDLTRAMRIYKSRKNAMAMLTGVTTDSKQFFTSCDQSSNTENCGLGMDDDATQEFSQCAVTMADDPPWWRGYLETPIYMTSVYIQNANWNHMSGDDGLKDFSISGNGHECFTHFGEQSFQSRTFPCDILASDVEIRSNTKHSTIAICEVQVYGAVLRFPGMNTRAPMLKYRDCELSSVSGIRHSWLAQDGMDSGLATRDHCAQTGSENMPWWRGTFEVPAIVQQVAIYAGTDCCQSDVTNIEIKISSRLCAKYRSHKQFKTKAFYCNMMGSEVLIQRMSKGKLTLCEVVVAGFALQMNPAPEKRKMMGCFKDDPLNPDLSDLSGPVAMTLMHPDKCDKMCRRMGKKYFGLQGGSDCWCGDSYGKYGTAGKTRREMEMACSMRCEGRHMEYCGGYLKSIVYMLM